VDLLALLLILSAVLALVLAGHAGVGVLAAAGFVVVVLGAYRPRASTAGSAEGCKHSSKPPVGAPARDN
jgi:membrane-bound ClpP family serine protease